ncbi:molybdopterin converting factor subunit 1 [Dasania sp. GY-MA-18]|uniref:Molybdopterin synthase sulfur carrier subunit n=1 Tax=Dasania phycosphaerae TaxID=2950436 RepID=A0A9J6RJX7_9GAMM|nr:MULTISPECIES: molybdopterin converting factor subunit 1 [Dasania]MCR8922569.1 molybdopterin converting factor subunit 1 [Dasania sp. GY-MA-18]MCZ0864998.1 molybdopterin converting factor subunit 1 [Dasania phycosphaerae]MCZ0868725.1 molybdopterin converting factor subunit 1 [Dasania phycosphaerae]
MVKVLFFASYREALGLPEVAVTMPHNMSLAEFKQWLITENGDSWQAVLNAPNSVQAVNQTVADDDQPVVDGDEVAFFPPVTGG